MRVGRPREWRRRLANTQNGRAMATLPTRRLVAIAAAVAVITIAIIVVVIVAIVVATITVVVATVVIVQRAEALQLQPLSSRPRWRSRAFGIFATRARTR